MNFDLPLELESARRVKVSRGEQVFRQGEACHNYYIALSGCIKVFARSPGGKEIVLYRVEPGDICVLTTSCILSNSDYPADAIAETDVTAIALPKGDFDRLMHDSDEFRSFVLSSFGNRLKGLITLVEQVALESIEQRLATFLLERTDIDHQMLEATHQDIATEIGTAREVVSRQVKSLAERRVVSLARGSITVLDRAALEESAGGR
jgi:CRP/FNR family transcriptional regulator